MFHSRLGKVSRGVYGQWNTFVKQPLEQKRSDRFEANCLRAEASEREPPEFGNLPKFF